jgi:4-hydroxy-tetrahydrodipicolinate synthase
VAVTQPPFQGVAVALATLFDAHDEVDVPATVDHAVRLCHAGLHAVVVAGTTGEAAALTPDERRVLLRAVRAAVPDGVALIAGTGAPSVRQAVVLTRDAVDEGVDAVLALSPPSAANVRPYYDAVVTAAGSASVLAYHYPEVSAPGIAVDDLAGLPVAGLKDSSGDAERLIREATAWSGHLYTGATSLAYLAGRLGCAGAILAIANIEPATSVAAFEGDLDAQKALVDAGVRARPVPGGLKAEMHRRFGTSTVTRVG